MKRKIPLLLKYVLQFIVGVIIGLVIVTTRPPIFASNGNNNVDGRLAQVFDYIQTLYVDEVEARRLMEVGIRAMTDKLDRHSQFLVGVSRQASDERVQGGRETIGLSFYLFSDTAFVLNVALDSPAQKAGIMPGDRIIYIDETLVAGANKNSQDIENSLRISADSSIEIKVQRRGIPDLLDIHIEHGRTPIFTVQAAYMVTEEIGYIRLNAFLATSADEFRTAKEELQRQGMQHLILDLIVNGGGRFTETVAITDHFLPQNKLIASIKGRNYSRTYMSTDDGNLLTGRVVVLVSERSASGSEVLAGAIQDWDRGVIVGRRTLGKGAGQRLFPFPNGTQLNLTTRRAFTPSGRSIEDIYLSDSLRFFTLRNNREVFNGGISPDYYVPNTITYTTRYRTLLLRRNIPQFVAMLYVDENRSELLDRYPNATAFQNNFQIPTSMIDRLREVAEIGGIRWENIAWDNPRFERSNRLIVRTMKSHIAAYLFGRSAYFQIMNNDADIFQAGLRIISNPEKYENLLKGIGGNVNDATN